MARSTIPPSAVVNPNLARSLPPPVMEARRWLEGMSFPADRPLLDVSQAAPADPPPESMIATMTAAVAARASDKVRDVHVYGPALGDADLREQIATDWSRCYSGTVAAEQVAVTPGCNQAFCTAALTLCAPGDALILPVPWYFNHKMWLDMIDVEARPIPCDERMLPDIDAARAAMDARVRGVALVTPNNPTGAEYPDALMNGFFDLCREHGVSLILDETYRDFHSGAGAPHGLFARSRWDDTLIHLYSFSKVFRLTGYRVGAMIADPVWLAQAEKVLDATAICPNRLGQAAALHGLQNLGDWIAVQRAEILARRVALEAFFARDLPDWRILGAGAYFAWVEHPFPIPSDELARRLVHEQSVLALPGTMFTPEGSDWYGARHLRLAFANVDRTGLEELARRLAQFCP